jgi:hypothetical protein
MKKQQIKWRAVKVISKPIKVEFFDKKNGKTIFLKGVKGVEVCDPEQLQTLDLIRWLRKNKFKSLAKALTIAIKCQKN